MRTLIVNADDFGLSPGVNDGVLQAHVQGIVTSASLMVRRRATVHAVGAASGFPGLSLGLHVDLGEWVYRDGEWTPLYVWAEMSDEAAVAAELESQVAAHAPRLSPARAPRRALALDHRGHGAKARYSAAPPTAGPILRRILRPNE